MKLLYTIILTFTASICLGQFRPLDSLDLESGEYYVLAKFSESDPNSLRDSLGEFYINDIEILKEIRDVWNFTQESPFYACGYHYSFLICKNGESINGFSVNLNCNTLSSNNGSYNFESEQLRFLKDKIQHFYKETKNLDIEDSRNYLNSIRDDSNLIYAPNPIWMEYEGDFKFTYNYPEGTQWYWPESEDKVNPDLLKYTTDSILVKLRRLIKNKYPNEAFELNDAGGSLKTVIVEVTSNKSLEEKFDLYERTDSQKWDDFNTRFTTYWTEKPIKKPIISSENKTSNKTIVTKQTESKNRNYLWLVPIIVLIGIIGFKIIKTTR
jgi:hypothetical protein